MTALNRNPINPNFLAPNKFQLNFARTPNLQYFCQTITLPGIATSEIAITNPFVELYSPGEKAVYDQLNITFMVDEGMLAWLEIHDWLRAMTFPTEFEEYQQLGKLNQFTTRKGGNFPQFSDATVTLLSSANNPIYRISYKDAFPVSLSGFTLSTTDTPDSIITADATFRFTYFNIERI
jgi:hypothetical protein